MKRILKCLYSILVPQGFPNIKWYNLQCANVSIHDSSKVTLENIMKIVQYPVCDFTHSMHSFAMAASLLGSSLVQQVIELI